MDKKYFTLKLLIARWRMKRQDVLHLLTKGKVPGKIIVTKNNKSLDSDIMAVDLAYFYENDIYRIEQEFNINHSKIKPRSIEKYENK